MKYIKRIPYTRPPEPRKPVVGDRVRITVDRLWSPGYEHLNQHIATVTSVDNHYSGSFYFRFSSGAEFSLGMRQSVGRVIYEIL